MLNQTYHFKDFGIKPTWQLFTISHGKSHCHEIGGATKIFTAKEGLQRFYRDQYLLLSQKKSGKSPWNKYNLYPYSSGSAAKRKNEIKISIRQNNHRKTN